MNSAKVFQRLYLAKSCNQLGFSRNISTSKNACGKIAVLGACGHIGQPLSMLLKMNPRVSSLAMYDILYPQGVAMDLSQIPTTADVKGYGAGQIGEAVKGVDIVICTAGMPRKSGIKRDEQFRLNAKVVKDLAEHCALFNPGAIYCIVTNPINSTVPLWCEIFKQAGILNEKKILGISNLELMRASSYIAKELGIKPSEVTCPVIGGLSGTTVIPVLSQCQPKINFSQEKTKLVTYEVREAGAEIVKAKQGQGTVALSIAWSAHHFIDSLLRAMDGEKGVTGYAYVKSNSTDAKYFSNCIELGKEGLEKNLGLPPLNDYEKKLLNDECLPQLTMHIKAGEGAAFDDRPDYITKGSVM